jgi:hypothetical protein
MLSRLCRWVAWPLLTAIVFVTLSPIGWRPVTGAPVSLERIAAFAALGAVFSIGYPKHRIPVLLFLLVSAGALEAVQSLIPTRHGRVPDAAVKAAGAIVGVFAAGRLATWCPHLFR